MEVKKGTRPEVVGGQPNIAAMFSSTRGGAGTNPHPPPARWSKREDISPAATTDRQGLAEVEQNIPQTAVRNGEIDRAGAKVQEGAHVDGDTVERLQRESKWRLKPSEVTTGILVGAEGLGADVGRGLGIARERPTTSTMTPIPGLVAYHSGDGQSFYAEAALQKVGPDRAHTAGAQTDHGPPRGEQLHRQECNRGAQQRGQGDTSESGDKYKRSWLSIPPDSAAAVNRLMNLGISTARIDVLTRDGALGPRSGISDADRVLRALDIGILPLDYLRDTQPSTTTWTGPGTTPAQGQGGSSA